MGKMEGYGHPSRRRNMAFRSGFRIVFKKGKKEGMPLKRGTGLLRRKVQDEITICGGRN